MGTKNSSRKASSKSRSKQKAVAKKQQNQENSKPSNQEDIPPALKGIPPEILNDLPDELKDLPPGELRAFMAMSMHVGPLPSPETLQQYEHISPGAAPIIINEMVKVSDHAIAMEVSENTRRDKVTAANIIYRQSGQIMAFLVIMAVLIMSFVLILKGFKAEGISGGLIGMGTIISLLVHGKYQESKTRQTKDSQDDE